MSVYPCAVCGQRVPGKLASIYWAWFKSDGERSAFKQRSCAPCIAERLRAVLRSANEASPAVSMCPVCGTDSSGDLDPIYATVFLPKQEPREYALTTCATCAVGVRAWAQEGAQPLADRGGISQGPRPSAPDADWGSVL